MLIHDGEKNTAYYVDSIGFREVKDFLESSQGHGLDKSTAVCEEKRPSDDDQVKMQTKKKKQLKRR